ncbi:MAG: phosphoadenosine phosphosulfate reductase family protein [Thermoplasmata archaeon]
MTSKPSVLVVVLDTLRAEAFSLPKLSTMPALQSFLGESITFSRAYSPSHWTLPSHASLFTGMTASEHEARAPFMRLREDVRTIAEVFQANDYFTACLTCNPILSEVFGLTRGFQVTWSPASEWKSSLSKGYKLLSKWLRREGLTTPLFEITEKIGAVLASTPRSDNGALDAINYALDLARRRQNPMFLLLNLMEAHHPYHGRGVFSRWKYRFRHSDIFGLWQGLVWGTMGGRLKIPGQKQELLKRIYWENVKYLDSQFGTFIQGLPPHFLDDGYIIILSDHGQLLGEKGKIDHVSGLDELLLRVPLAVRPPGGGANRDVNWPLDISMLFFLLRDIASGDSLALDSWLERIQAQDMVLGEAHGGLVPHMVHLVGRDPTYRADLIAFRSKEDHPALAAVADRWKLICHLGRKDDELYDLEKDPSEEMNLVTTTPDRADRLHRELASRFSQGSQGNVGPRYLDTLSVDTKKKISELVLLETLEKGTNPALLWTGGKDSTLALFLLLGIARGASKAASQLVFVDHGQHFEETWTFMHDIAESEGLSPIIARNDSLLTAAGESNVIQLDLLDPENQEEALRAGLVGSEVPLDLRSTVGNHLLKTVPLKRIISKHEFDYVVTGIRWDENLARSVEVFFSPREDPPHTRVHPILPWTEAAVWSYTLETGIPIHPLYKRGYRSFDGVRDSEPTSEIPAWEQDLKSSKERAGRAQDKEEIMERLRSLGYF